ncbi:DNA translocase FtsK, partial [Candidatus Microgenomates bacterium]|nr:DNA translocase FtsK [Candidatus Microgenomates bacterium]
MARRKKLFKLPFKFKVNNRTIFNIIGMILIAAGIIMLLSMFSAFLGDQPGGSYIIKIHEKMTEAAGLLAYAAPFILFVLSTHFFAKKKKKLLRAHVTIGTVLIYIALLGVFRSGSIGSYIYNSLTNDFSVPGGLLILTITFFIGLILFLDTSVDAFVIFAVKLFQAFVYFIKNHLFRELLNRKPGEKKVKEAPGDDAFIKDSKSPLSLFKPKTPETKPQVAPNAVKAVPAASGEMVMKPLAHTASTWVYPPMSLLHDVSQQAADRGDVRLNATTIERTLESFGIRARVAEVNNGPTVTQYALEITMGTKLSKITALGNDLALALAAPTGQVRIEAPIPGRSMVGIEIPNIRPEIVTLKRLMSAAVFKNSTDPLLVPLGLDVSGNTQGASIAKMPHVLIAGTTGSGKSVMLNAWIATMLFRTKPEELRMIMVDPKRVELSVYNGIPHLYTEVIVEPDKIISALRWTVAEMESRYKEFAKVGVRNLEGYNATAGVEKKPFILFIIDELADLMMFAPGDAEDLITRIAQMARATGIHLLLATQRPSVDVITGLMKANIPTRIAFNVSSLVDSRVIIDTPGAEK